MTAIKRDIREIDLEAIKEFVLSNRESTFRAKQIFEWLWKHCVSDFSEMKNIPESFRNLLSQNFSINKAKIRSIQVSSDKTIKAAFLLHDNEIIEGVLIPTESRATACISTQCGCPLDCSFCATGKLGFKRNLSAGEIYDQVFELRKLANEKYSLQLTNIVIMGMGEPLLNYGNLLSAIAFITGKDGLQMSPDRITLSTAGLPKMIKKLADDNIKFNLSVSLHAANNEKRSRLMPVNIQNNLESLTESLRYFYSKTKSRITLEYLLLDGINDTLNDAKELAVFCKSFPVKINIIEFNDVSSTSIRKSKDENLKKFVDFLESKNIIVNVRRSRGKDIDAACGQLAAKSKHI